MGFVTAFPPRNLPAQDTRPGAHIILSRRIKVLEDVALAARAKKRRAFCGLVLMDLKILLYFLLRTRRSWQSDVDQKGIKKIPLKSSNSFHFVLLVTQQGSPKMWLV